MDTVTLHSKTFKLGETARVYSDLHRYPSHEGFMLDEAKSQWFKYKSVRSPNCTECGSGQTRPIMGSNCNHGSTMGRCGQCGAVFVFDTEAVDITWLICLTR